MAIPIVGLGVILTVITVFTWDRLPENMRLPLLVITIAVDVLALVWELKKASKRS